MKENLKHFARKERRKHGLTLKEVTSEAPSTANSVKCGIVHALNKVNIAKIVAGSWNGETKGKEMGKLENWNREQAGGRIRSSIEKTRPFEWKTHDL